MNYGARGDIGKRNGRLFLGVKMKIYGVGFEKVSSIKYLMNL